MMLIDGKGGFEMCYVTNNFLTGINVRDDKNINYAYLICSGKKSIETRNSNSLKPYIGKRVRIIRTGVKNYKATVVGECTIGKPKLYYSEDEFSKDFSQHKVPKNSIFWIKEGSIKYGYPILEPILYEKVYFAIGSGIVARKNQPSPVSSDVNFVDTIEDISYKQLEMNL